MSETQLTLVQIDNYGPWTVSPTPRAEPDIQTFQSRLYADLSQAMNAHGAYVFYTRFDNMIAVTNGMDRNDIRSIQQSIANRYPVTASFASARDAEPAKALTRATAALQATGSAQDGTRREELVFADSPAETLGPNDVTVAHFDVIDVTGGFTDELPAYEAFLEIERVYGTLMRHLYRAHGALAFFVGGDNIIAICPNLAESAYRSTLDHVQSETGIKLQVGVGSGARAGDAGMAAKHALERCRTRGTTVTVSRVPTQSSD